MKLFLPNKRALKRVLFIIALMFACTCTIQAKVLTVSSTPSDWGYENAAEVSKVTIGEFTVTFAKGTGSVTPKYYTSDKTMRLYGGNTVTVTSANSAITPTKFGDNELTNGTYSFTATTKYKTVTITYIENEKILVGDIYYIIEGTSAAVAGCAEGTTTLNIPGAIEYDGKTYSVTSIDAEAFKDNIDLTTATLPNTITSIGQDAFAGCTNIVKSAYPDNLTNPFEYSLAIAYPANNALIEDGIVWNSDKSTLYYVPTYFEGEFIIPESVKVIGGDAFTSCQEITSVSIPSSVTTINDYAFVSCTGLTTINIPNSVTSVGEYAFDNCTSLTTATLSNSIIAIPDGLFMRCSSLTSIIIPESVVYIGEYAFRKCEALKKCAYPNSISNPFTDYGRGIEYPAYDALIEDGIIWSTDKSTLYFVPIDFEGDFNIPSSVTTIDNYAFYLCEKMASVSIPNSVTSINNYAFEYCSLLTSIELPNSITSIGNSAFEGCAGLTSIEIPSSITTINKNSFASCTSLTSLTIPNSVTTIKDNAFWWCTGLNSVNLGESVSSIEGSAFGYCTSLTSITIPQSVTTIGDFAFEWCSKLESAIILGSINSLSSAFTGCSALKSLELSKNIKLIEDEAFLNNTSIRKVTAHATEPATIGENTFAEDTYNQGTLYVPTSSVAAYKAAAGWKNFAEIKALENSVSKIEADNGSNISTENGAICISGNKYVRVISTNGQTVYNGFGETRISVSSGIYVVISGDKATKVAVK